MRSIRPIVAFVCLISAGACGAPSAPTTPAPTPVRSNLAVASFGVLVPPAAQVASSTEFGRCLASVGYASCFSAATMLSAPLSFSNAQSKSGVGRIGGASVANSIPDPPSSLTFFVGFDGSTIYFSWRAPTTTPAPTNYTVEAGSAPSLADIASFCQATGETDPLPTLKLTPPRSVGF